MGQIIAVDTDGISLKVIDVLRGTESRRTIRIWDGTDWDCNGPISMAASNLGEVNDSIVLLLPKITSKENTWDIIGDYRRPSYYYRTPNLKVKNGIVKGLISGYWRPLPNEKQAVAESPYKWFREEWLNKGSCDELLGLNESEYDPSQIKYNSLIASELNVAFAKQPSLNGQISIFNSNGTRVFDSNHLSKEMKIDLSFLNSGVYVVRLTYEQQSHPLQFRIIKK